MMRQQYGLFVKPDGNADTRSGEMLWLEALRGRGEGPVLSVEDCVLGVVPLGPACVSVQY